MPRGRARKQPKYVLLDRQEHAFAEILDEEKLTSVFRLYGNQKEFASRYAVLENNPLRLEFVYSVRLSKAETPRRGRPRMTALETTAKPTKGRARRGRKQGVRKGSPRTGAVRTSVKQHAK